MTTTTAEDPLVARGRQVFFRESYCVLCHSIQGTPAAGVIGPNLTRIGSRGTIAAGLLENRPPPGEPLADGDEDEDDQTEMFEDED